MSKDIVQVLLNYGVNLQFHNGLYKALCPFHNEATPSFVVYPETQSWYCYGSCGKGGDVIEFVKLWHKISYKEALKELNLENETYSLRTLQEKLTEEVLISEEKSLLRYYFLINKLLYGLNLSFSKKAKFVDLLLKKKDLRRIKVFYNFLRGTQ